MIVGLARIRPVRPPITKRKKKPVAYIIGTVMRIRHQNIVAIQLWTFTSVGTAIIIKAIPKAILTFALWLMVKK